MSVGLLLGAFFLLLVAAALWSMARRSRAMSGLPRGRVVYVDSHNWEKTAEVLRAPRYGLVGRPDYLMRAGRAVIPVESKPSRWAGEPYAGDLLQLAAYCLLVEENYRVTPPHGLLVYADRTFEVPFDAEMRRQLLHTLAEMRRSAAQEEVTRSHDQPARCAACGMRVHCGEEALE